MFKDEIDFLGLIQGKCGGETIKSKKILSEKMFNALSFIHAVICDKKLMQIDFRYFRTNTKI